MSKKLLKSRKGVSGAISGIFVILVCFLALGAIFVYAINLDRYNQVVNERNRMEWEIQNEKFTITHAQRNDNGTLNATIFNFGGMTAHIVDMWVTMKNGTSNESLQELYRVDYHINPVLLDSVTFRFLEGDSGVHSNPDSIFEVILIYQFQMVIL